MSVPYGFRIYVVKAFTNGKKGREPEDVSVGTLAQQRIVELLSQLNTGGTQFLAPSAPEDAGEPARARGRRAEGRPDASGPRFGRLLFDAHQAADNGYIDEILGAATSASATFTKKISSDRGARGEEVQQNLSIKLRDPESRSFVAVLGRQWFGRTREGNSTSQSQRVSEFGDLLEAQDLLDDGEQATYDSAAVTVKGTGNQSTTIKVDTMRDVFTYPVSQGPPNARYYYGMVAGRVETVAAAEGLEVLRIEPEEVQECLEGSISGP